MTCLIDNTDWNTKEEMHSHLKKIKVRQEVYYRKFFPKFDKFTGAELEFKNVDFYLHSYFNSRKNLIDYLKQNRNKDFISQIFKSRKEHKSLKYFPSTLETRTSILPSPLFIKSQEFSIQEIADQSNLELRYNYDFKNLQFDDFSPLEVICDTREQQPLEFECETLNSKISFGDYCSKTHFNNIFIDRKSLQDLCGTISQGFDRFKREFERAKQMGAYLIVGVEDSIDNLLNLPFLEEAKHIKASPDFICSRMRELCQEFNTQFFFSGNRIKLANHIKKIFLCKNDIRKLDLQFIIDSKVF